MDNLDSHTYEIFEKDPIKYFQYQRVSRLLAVLTGVQWLHIGCTMDAE